MADRSTIEWTNATWNPIRGCSRVSQGCVNCYAEVMAARFNGPGQWGEGLAEIVTRPDGSKDHRWTGTLVQAPEATLLAPLRWRRPRRIFVNSTSDLFHEAVPDDWIDHTFAVMALAPQHTFQILTKRPERMRAYFASRTDGDPWAEACDHIADLRQMAEHPAILEPTDMPLPNVWLGTSAEDQAAADARIPHLLATPAAVRFVSVEPMLGPVDLTLIPGREVAPGITHGMNALTGIDGDGAVGPRLDWVICGGESGPGARPMHPDWARALRDQCAGARVPFFFKQWGAWGPCDHLDEEIDGAMFGCFDDAGRWVHPVDQAWASQDRQIMYRLGKSRAGRTLDGRTCNQMPGDADA